MSHTTSPISVRCVPHNIRTLTPALMSPRCTEKENQTRSGASPSNLCFPCPASHAEWVPPIREYFNPCGPNLSGIGGVVCDTVFRRDIGGREIPTAGHQPRLEARLQYTMTSKSTGAVP